LKSIALNISKLLASYTKKQQLCDPVHVPFLKMLRVHVQTVHGNMQVKFQVRGSHCTDKHIPTQTVRQTIPMYRMQQKSRQLKFLLFSQQPFGILIQNFTDLFIETIYI